jgi:hypothetical protein
MSDYVGHMLFVVREFWQWLREYDASNWFVIFVSLFAWLFFIRRLDSRKRQYIPNLEVQPRQSQGSTTIGNRQFDAVEFVFSNRTGSTVYLYRAQLREHPKRFPIPHEAARDISGWRELKFGSQQYNVSNSSTTFAYVDHERVPQTNESATTVMAVSQKMDSTFYNYRPWWIHRWLRRPRYFLLQYTVMVGEKKYSVKSVF